MTPVTKAHSTAKHNRAICSAQAALGIIKSLFAPNHGPPFFCPLHMFFVALFFALRERSRRCQPPAERSPCILYGNVVVVTSKWTFGKWFGYNTRLKKLRLPSSTQPLSALRCRHVPSAKHHYDASAKERASVPHVGDGGAWKSPSPRRLA